MWTNKKRHYYRFESGEYQKVLFDAFCVLVEKITNLEKLIDDLILMMSSTFPKFNVPKFTFRKRLTVTGIYDIWQLKVIFNRESLTKLYQRATWFYKNIFLEYTGGTRLEHDRRPNFLIIANITFFKNYSLFLIRQNCKTFMESFALRTSHHLYVLCSDHHIFLLELINVFKQLELRLVPF